MCHAYRVAPEPAFDVMFFGVTAPAGPAEQSDKLPAGQ